MRTLKGLTPGQWRGLPRIQDAFGAGCELCDQTGHVCADDGAWESPGVFCVPGHHEVLHPWDGLSVRADACDHGGGAPCPGCSPAEPSLLDRLCSVRFTRSGCWSDAELLCVMAADGLDDLANAARHLGSWCYRRGVAAKARAEDL